MTGRHVSVLWCGKLELAFASPCAHYRGFGGVVATPMVRHHDPASQSPAHLGALIVSLFPKCGRVSWTLAEYDDQPVDAESRRLREDFDLGNGLDHPRPFGLVGVKEAVGGWAVQPYERTRGQSYRGLDITHLTSTAGDEGLGALVLRLLGVEVQPRHSEQEGRREKGSKLKRKKNVSAAKRPCGNKPGPRGRRGS